MALTFSASIKQFREKVVKELKDDKKAKRKALNAGAKEIKQIMRPFIPVLGKTSPYRQKGVLRKNLKHIIRMSRDGTNARAEIKIFSKKKGSKLINRKRIGVRDDGTILTGPIKVYINDPYYWRMVEQDTAHMSGRHYLERGFKAGKNRATAKARVVYIEEVKKALQKP